MGVVYHPVRYKQTEPLVDRPGGFNAGDCRFPAPLVTQDSQLLHGAVVQAQNFRHQSVIEFLPHGVAVGFVGEQHPLLAKGVKNIDSSLKPHCVNFGDVQRRDVGNGCYRSAASARSEYGYCLSNS